MIKIVEKNICTCDSCGFSNNWQYEPEYIHSTLTKKGWMFTENNLHFCPNCSKKKLNAKGDGYDVIVDGVVVGSLLERYLKVKEGDIICYPIGMSYLNVATVKIDENQDLYINEGPNDRRYIYKQNLKYKWDSRLCRELGFRIYEESQEVGNTLNFI